jgi:5'-nucleotidase
LPAIAISLVVTGRGAPNFATAARVASELVMRVQRSPLQSAILNVNVPDIPYEALKGYQATRLGFRHRSEPIVRSEDPRGRPVYWVGPAGVGQDVGPGTDFHAIANGYVSVTPLQIDLTRHSMLEDMRTWLAGRDS